MNDDLPRFLEVMVTDLDIELGVPGSVALCAIARAVDRRLDGFDVLVNRDVRVYTGTKLIAIYRMSPAAGHFIDRYDSWGQSGLMPPKPATLRFELVGKDETFDEAWHTNIHEFVKSLELVNSTLVMAGSKSDAG